MTDLSIAVRTKKASALRRWHKHVKIDLGSIAKRIYSQALVRDIYRDNERNMQRIVGAFVHVRLEQILFAVRLDYPDVVDARQLMGKVAFRKVPFVSDSQIHALALLMGQTRQESHYSAATISEYIVRSFNKNRKQYGVVAAIDFGDIVIIADPRTRRSELLAS